MTDQMTRRLAETGFGVCGEWLEDLDRGHTHAAPVGFDYDLARELLEPMSDLAADVIEIWDIHPGRGHRSNRPSIEFRIGEEFAHISFEETGSDYGETAEQVLVRFLDEVNRIVGGFDYAHRFAAYRLPDESLRVGLWPASGWKAASEAEDVEVLNETDLELDPSPSTSEEADSLVDTFSSYLDDLLESERAEGSNGRSDLPRLEDPVPELREAFERADARGDFEPLAETDVELTTFPSPGSSEDLREACDAYGSMRQYRPLVERGLFVWLREDGWLPGDHARLARHLLKRVSIDAETADTHRAYRGWIVSARDGDESTHVSQESKRSDESRYDDEIAHYRADRERFESARGDLLALETVMKLCETMFEQRGRPFECLRFSSHPDLVFLGLLPTDLADDIASHELLPVRERYLEHQPQKLRDGEVEALALDKTFDASSSPD